MTKHILHTIRGAARSGALVALMLAGLAVPAAATKIERIVSPGGIEFWLVRNSTVPLVAVNFAIRGGSSQDPADKAGLAEMTVATLDEGAGDLDTNAFQDRLERKAIELQLRATRDYVRGTLRTLTENQEEAFDLLGLALTKPRFDSYRGRARARPDDLAPAAAKHQPERHRRQELLGQRISKSSLRSPGQRHPRKCREASPPTTCAVMCAAYLRVTR